VKSSAPTAADGLEIILKDDEARTVLGLKGRLGIDSSPAFRDRLLALLQREPSKAIVIDLTELSYIDASGIATLLEGLKIARYRKITFCLEGLRGRMLHLFEVTGVLPLFEKEGCRRDSPESKVS
jgi:anti-sigma B factor antagonist